MDQNQKTATVSDNQGANQDQANPNDHNNTEKKVGPIIASLIIILILLITALYVFASRISQPVTPNDGPSTDAVTAVPPIAGTSTDLQSIQNDLNASTKGLNSANF
jgi:hypothetical protein